MSWVSLSEEGPGEGRASAWWWGWFAEYAGSIFTHWPVGGQGASESISERQEMGEANSPKLGERTNVLPWVWGCRKPVKEKRRYLTGHQKPCPA